MTSPSINPISQFEIQEGTMRDGIPVEKGIVLTEQFLSDNEELIAQYCNYFMLYPDLFLEMIQSKDCPIKLYYYQRLLMRAMIRYRYFFGTFTRATSKSFLAILTQYLICMFLPRSKRFVVSQYKKASLDITKQKLDEIWTYWPLLKTELKSSKMSTDYIELEFKNGSVFHILALSASSRGQRATGGVCEEAALIDGTLLSEVIIPMMNVPRLSAGGENIQDEPHGQQTYITSAGSKTTFAYERLIELLVDQCINPDDVFVCGSGYELPLYYGLFDKKTIEDQKMSSSFSEEGFARESMSIWTGTSQDSWFNQQKLLRSRNLMYCERKAAPGHNKDAYYEIGVDVGRYGNNDSSIMVIKVLPNTTAWKKQLVYTENITKASLQKQAVRIKQLYKVFMPKEIVIDGNGLGAGLIDEMVVASYDEKGQYYEPLYVFNDQENYPYPRDQKDKAIIYNIKANAQINTDVYSNLYTQFNSGNISLLANEKIVSEKLLTTVHGQKMSRFSREKYLLPYKMTSRLIDEINNLRLKPSTAPGQIAVEQISKRINKDRVSALGYGLYRIKAAEDEALRKNKNKDFLSMAFFSSRKKSRGE